MAERRACSRCERKLWHAGNHSWLGTMCIPCNMIFCDDCQVSYQSSPCRNCGRPVIPAENENFPSSRMQEWLSVDASPFSPESVPTKNPKVKKSPDELSKIDRQTIRNLFVDIASGDYTRTTFARQEIIAIGAPAFDECINFLKSFTDDYEQKVGADLLGSIGTVKAVAPLVALVEHSKLSVRLSAIRSLSQITEKESIAALNILLNHRISDVRDNAFTALNRIEFQLNSQTNIVSDISTLKNDDNKNAVSSIASDNPVQVLEKFKVLLDKGLISEQDYENKKAEVLAKM